MRSQRIRQDLATKQQQTSGRNNNDALAANGVTEALGGGVTSPSHGPRRGRTGVWMLAVWPPSLYTYPSQPLSYWSWEEQQKHPGVPELFSYMIRKGQDTGWISAQFGKSLLNLNPNSSYSSHQRVNQKVFSITPARQQQDTELNKQTLTMSWISSTAQGRDKSIPEAKRKQWDNFGSLVAEMVKNLPTKAGDTGLIPGSGRSPEGNGNPLQHSCLGNPMNREEPCGPRTRGSQTSQTWLSD